MFTFPARYQPNIEDVLIARISKAIRVGVLLVLPTVPPCWLLIALKYGAVFNKFWLVLLVTCPAFCFPIGWVLMFGRVSLRSCLIWIAVFCAYWSATFPLARQNRAMHGKYQAIRMLMGSTAAQYEADEFAIRSFEKLPHEFQIYVAKHRSAAPLFKLAKDVKVHSVNYDLPWRERSNEDLQSLSELRNVPRLNIEMCNTCEGEVRRVSSAVGKMVGLTCLNIFFTPVADPMKDRAFLRQGGDRNEYLNKSLHEEGFEQVLGLPNLKIVAIDGSRSPRQYLDKLRPGSGVEELLICGGVWKPDDLSKLRQLPRLKRLSFCQMTLTNEHLIEISNLSKTRRLQFWEPGLSEQFIADNPQIDFRQFVVGDGG